MATIFKSQKSIFLLVVFALSSSALGQQFEFHRDGYPNFVLPKNSPSIAFPPETQIGVKSDAEEDLKCITKVMMTEELVYDEEMKCIHSFKPLCYDSPITVMKPYQEPRCSYDYKKECFIEMIDTAVEVTVNICREPLLKNCDIEGPEICEIVSEVACETLYEDHAMLQDRAICKLEKVVMCKNVTVNFVTNSVCEEWPKRSCSIDKVNASNVIPESKCSSVKRELCGSSGCPVVSGPKECHPETRLMHGQMPKEECNIIPVEKCITVTKLLPSLTYKEVCIDVPNEVCSTIRTNPHIVKKPFIKNWCFKPQEQSLGTNSVDRLSSESSAIIETLAGVKSQAVAELPTLYEAPAGRVADDRYKSSDLNLLTQYIEQQQSELELDPDYSRRIRGVKPSQNRNQFPLKKLVNLSS